MASVELTTEQVIDLIKSLSADSKRDILLALAEDSKSSLSERMALADRQLREIAGQRGLNWGSMSDDERQAMTDDLIHEDRSCHE